MSCYLRIIFIFYVLNLLFLCSSCKKDALMVEDFSSLNTEEHIENGSTNNIQQDTTTNVIQTAENLLETTSAPLCSINRNQNFFTHENDWRNHINNFSFSLFEAINQNGLTQESAIQLALINNPELFAYYENLEIGYANLLEAGLRHNPLYKEAIRKPNEEGYSLNKVYELSIDFLDFFLIPFRQQVALAELEVIKADIAQKIIDLVRDVQTSWIDTKTLIMEFQQEAIRVELKSIAAELSELQKNAGNISDLQARKYKIDFEQSTIRLANLQTMIEISKENLNRTLGLFGNETCWEIAGELDWRADSIVLDITGLEEAAINNRPDIESIRNEIIALAQEAQLKEPWTFSNIRIGTSREKEPEGVIVSGPSIELELPIYNYGQADAIKYAALIEQAQNRLLAKAVEICSEVRKYFKTYTILHSQLENFEREILPTFEQQITDAQSHYNVMTLGIYTLFDIKESQIQATMDYIQILNNYFHAKIELLRAVGGSFDVLRGKS